MHEQSLGTDDLAGSDAAAWNLRYATGENPWDTGIVPPEVVALVESARLAPGLALDLGCGTGTNSIYLAQHGYHAIGVDLALLALVRAQQRVRHTGLPVWLSAADVSDLAFMRVKATLALDVGCFHALSATQRANYISSLAAHTLTGAVYLLYAFDWRLDSERASGVKPADLGAFAPWFSLRSAQHGQDRDRPASWYLFVRTSRPVLPGLR